MGVVVGGVVSGFGGVVHNAAVLIAGLMGFWGRTAVRTLLVLHVMQPQRVQNSAGLWKQDSIASVSD